MRRSVAARDRGGAPLGANSSRPACSSDRVARRRWRDQDAMTRGPLRKWRERGGRRVRIALPFDDIMEFALALLSVSPEELEALGWRFADRKRLPDHFLRSGKDAQRTAPDRLGHRKSVGSGKEGYVRVVLGVRPAFKNTNNSKDD